MCDFVTWFPYYQVIREKMGYSTRRRSKGCIYVIKFNKKKISRP